MGARLEAGNKHLLVVVDRASKVRFAYPLFNKNADNVVKKLLELLLTFGIPLSLRSDPGTEFNAVVVNHLCKWLNVTIDYGPTDHPRAQGAVERLGGWIHEILMELCKVGLDGGTNTCNQPFGCIEQQSTHDCQAKRPPSANYSVETAVPR